jgi:hypothetical protein
MSDERQPSRQLKDLISPATNPEQFQNIITSLHTDFETFSPEELVKGALLTVLLGIEPRTYDVSAFAAVVEVDKHKATALLQALQNLGVVKKTEGEGNASRWTNKPEVSAALNAILDKMP